MRPYGTTRRMEIKVSRSRLLLFMLLLLVGAAIGIAITDQVLARPYSNLELFAVVLGNAFSLFCVIAFIRRFFETGAVITLSPAGLKHAWLSSETIPWPAIDRIEMRVVNYNKLIYLHLDPEFDWALYLSRDNRLMGRSPIQNSKTFMIAAAMLEITPDYLYELLLRYAHAHSGNDAQSLGTGKMSREQAGRQYVTGNEADLTEGPVR